MYQITRGYLTHSDTIVEVYNIQVLYVIHICAISAVLKTWYLHGLWMFMDVYGHPSHAVGNPNITGYSKSWTEHYEWVYKSLWNTMNIWMDWWFPSPNGPNGPNICKSSPFIASETPLADLEISMDSKVQSCWEKGRPTSHRSPRHSGCHPQRPRTKSIPGPCSWDEKNGFLW